MEILKRKFAKLKADYMYKSQLSLVEEVLPWTVITGEKHLSTLELTSLPVETERASSVADSVDQHAENAVTRADHALKARIRLGKLANWRGPIAIEAVRLTEAIEKVMAAMISKLKPTSSDIFSWNIPVRFGGSDVVISVQIKWINGAWKAPADKIEAILSLWLYSIQSRRKTEEESGRSKQTLEDESDSLLRSKESPEGVGLRVLHTINQKLQLLRDLRWWTPKGIGAPEVLEIWPSDQLHCSTAGETIKSAQCRVVGSGIKLGSNSKGTQNPDAVVVYDENPFQVREQHSDDQSLDDEDDRSSDEIPATQDGESTKPSNGSQAWLAIKSFDSLERLYAQDLFFAFMSAIAMSGDAKIPISETEVVPQKSNDTMNNLRDFALTNTVLSRLVHDIHGVGMGSLQEAWFGIITPLSLHEKLPSGDLSAQHAQLAIENFQGDLNFNGMRKVCCWLLDQVVTCDWQRHARPRAIAMVLRLLSEITLQIEAKEQDESTRFEAQEFVTRLSRKLKSWKKILRNLPPPQLRESLSGVVCLDFIQAFDVDDPTEFGIPRGCLPTLGKDGKYWTMKELNEFWRQPNFLHWTPWHYVSTLEVKDGEVTKEFLAMPPGYVATANSPDIWGWTSLHYACWRGNDFLVRELITRGAEINVRRKDGISPMHCAVRSGNADVVKVLIKPPLNETKPFKSSQDYLGSHPIHLAAANSQVSEVCQPANQAGVRCAAIVELLKSDLDLADGEGNTALHIAVLYDNAALVEWLVNNMDVETIYRSNLNSMSALGLALKKKNDECRKSIIRMIVEAGVDLSAGGSGLRQQVLHDAIEKDDDYLVRILLEKGVAVDEVDYAHRVALHRALDKPLNSLIVKALLDSDKSMNENAVTLELQDYRGFTPLHIAVRHAHDNLSVYEDFLSCILEYNPNMNFDIRDNCGRTALDWAEGTEIRGPLIEQIERQKQARLQKESATADSSAP